MSKEKPHNGGQWTDARKRQFIMSGLRALSNKWPPKWEVKKAARLERGIYLCSGYKVKPHPIPATIKDGKKRVNNVCLDHVHPVIDPQEGWLGWDVVINRLLVEANFYQVLCLACHSKKTADERILRKHSKEHKSE